MRMAGSAARLTARPALTHSPTQADTAKLGPISPGTAKSPFRCAALRHRAGKACRSIRCNRAEPPAPRRLSSLQCRSQVPRASSARLAAAIHSSIVYVLAQNESRVWSKGETVGPAQPGAFGQMRCSPLLKPGDRAEPPLPFATPSPDAKSGITSGKPTCDQRGTFSREIAAALELVASSGVTFRLPVKGEGT